MVVAKQASFTGGELAPSLQSRTDLEKYRNSLAEAYNVFIHTHGGISNLQGTEHIDAAYDSSYKSRLIPFQFNTTQTYSLEFSEKKMRIIKDGGIVQKTGADYVVTSPYSAADLPTLKFFQSADVMTLVHPLYPVYELSRTDHDAWTFTAVTFDPATMFDGAGEYPSAGTYFEQRSVYGGTTLLPDTINMSKTGDYKNFNVSSPLVDDDAIEASVFSRQVNEIRHFVPLNDLLIFTSGSEFKATSGSEPLTYQTIRIKPQSYIGCSHVPPLVIGYECLFVQARGSLVRSLGYSLERDGYVGSNLSVLANHFFEGHEIKEWCFAQIPNSLIFAVRDDGKLLILTYMPEQEVWGWSLGETDGEYESVCSIPEGSEDAVYFTVKRTINGSVVRHIERLHTRQFTDIRDCFFVHDGLSIDSPVVISGITAADPVVVTTTAHHGFSNGDEVDIFDVVGMTELNGRRFTVANKTDHTFELTTSGGVDIDGSAYTAYISGGTARKAVSSVSGLAHLEGKEVSCLCDGNVVSGKTVSSGAVSFTRKFSRIHIGLPYTSRIKTLALDFANGALNGKKRRVPSVFIEMVNSRGVKAGGVGNTLEELLQREFENLGAPTEVFTGQKKLPINQDWDRQGQIIIQQDYPLPLTITAVLPEVEVGG